MRKIISLFLLLTVGAFGASTTINPPPPSEGNTVTLVTSLFPDFIRLDDGLDIFWDSATGEFVLAFEDHPTGDFDFNDYIQHVVMEDGTVINSTFIGSWSVVHQNIGFNGVLWYDTTVLGTMWSNPALNHAGKDHLVTWYKPAPPVSDVPEPAAWVLFGAGLLIVAGLRRREQC